MKLHPGEALIFAEADIDGLHVASNEAIDQKYIKGDVRIVTEQARYPLNAIPSMVDSGDYELNPEFQRRHRWDTTKKSRLIESFIMNVPIPPVFLYEDRYSHYEVMDGLQRLTAISEFYTDKYSLEGLQEWSELNGRRYSELPEQIRRGIDRRYLSSIILLQETAKNETEALRLKQLVFERINSGGIKLEPQESRNAIYNGPLNQLCISLARNVYLCRMWGIPEPTPEEIQYGTVPDALLENESYRKMDDVELVLRFFAYRQRLQHHKGALRDYLDRFLKHGNLLPEDVLAFFQTLFEATVKLVYDTLGEQAFWLWRKRVTGWSWYSRPTTVLYDPVMFAFSQNLEHADELRARSDEIRARLPRFYESNYDSFEGRYTNLSNIGDRNQLFVTFLADVLNRS
ncbi:MAG TPA: DUF262 domain-containing protein [Longimicrobiaceae bacterium]|nr:DUF262 domain-containing protein [Longimicrobiaceae bacterium]